METKKETKIFYLWLAPDKDGVWAMYPVLLSEDGYNTLGQHDPTFSEAKKTRTDIFKEMEIEIRTE